MSSQPRVDGSEGEFRVVPVVPAGDFLDYGGERSHDNLQHSPPGR